MAKSVNKFFFLGHVGSDPNIKALSSGVLVANISLATSDRYKQGNEWKDRTDWHYLTVYGKLAEVVREYVHKGDRLHVEGRIRQDSWEQGGQIHYRANFVVEDLTMLGSSGKRADAGQGNPYHGKVIEDEDIPF